MKIDSGTYKHVNYYELLGERVNVDSFAVMVRSVAAKLYDLDSSIIEQMASALEVFPTWLNPVFAYDESSVRNQIKLKKDADIYISSGYSAYDCICFIRALLKKYDLDLEEDFVYSARPTARKDNELWRGVILVLNGQSLDHTSTYLQKAQRFITLPLSHHVIPYMVDLREQGTEKTDTGSCKCSRGTWHGCSWYKLHT